LLLPIRFDPWSIEDFLPQIKRNGQEQDEHEKNSTRYFSNAAEPGKVRGLLI